jgi:hypothetical protein
MSGSRWRLLAAFSLIFLLLILLAAPPLLGQDTAVERSPTLSLTVPPKGSPLRYSAPIVPIRTPQPPDLPGRYRGYQSRGVLQQLVRAAGIIFSGRVTFIGKAASSARPDPAATAITFQVEHAIRGTSTGQSLTIHEWAGLWTSGERYRVGQRVLLFLYSPGKLGLTSPVAGGMGRFPIDSQGQIVMTAQHVAFLAADPILGGKTVVPYSNFALAVRRAGRED